MSRKGALFAALAGGFVLLISIVTESARAEDRRERDGPSVLQMSAPPPSRVLRLLERIGFRSLDRRDESPATVLTTTEDASRSATASVSDETTSVPDTRAALTTTPHEVVLSTDKGRPSNKLREPRSTTSNRFDAAGGSGQQNPNPLRGPGPPPALRRPTLTFSDGGPVADKLRLAHDAEPTREADPVGGPAKVHLEDQSQLQESERQVAAATDVDGTRERIPAFKISSSSRRTAHLWTNKANVADELDTARRRAPNATRDDARASREDAPRDELATSRPPGEPEGRPTPKVVVGGQTVRQQKDAGLNTTVEVPKATLSDSFPPAINPLRSTQRRKTNLRPKVARTQSSPAMYHPDQPLVTPSATLPADYRKSDWRSPTDQVTKHATVNKPGISAQGTPLQPRSTIVSRIGTIPGPTERDVQKIALARNAIPSRLGQPSLRREVSLPRASVPTVKERTSQQLPKAILRNRLPSNQSVAPVNTLRGRRAIAAVSRKPQITAPKLLPKDEPQVEIKPLPPSSPSLRLAVRESRMIRSPENVVRVASANVEVCQVVQLNARDVAVVGKSRGTTKIEFWYDNRGISRVSHVVAVGPDQAFETPEEDRNQEVHKLISYLFPDSQVELISEEDRLIVRGRTGSRRQAVDILSTIRRSQLVPVVDELIVQDD